jgi:hypothetical protein
MFLGASTGRVLLQALRMEMGNRIFRIAMRLGWLARAAFVFVAEVSRQASAGFCYFPRVICTTLPADIAPHDCDSFFLRLYLFLIARERPEKF